MWQALKAFFSAPLGKATALAAIKVWQVAAAIAVVSASVGTYAYVQLKAPSSVNSDIPQRVVVFVGGINTEMSNCQLDSFGDFISSYLVKDIGVTGPYAEGCNAARQNYLQSSTSMINFSYDGGKMDEQRGVWLPNNYKGCDANTHRLADDITNFSDMLTAYQKVFPSARFTIVGHSLGGLVGLQGAYTYLKKYGHNSIDKVITVDSPLEGLFLKQQFDRGEQIALGHCSNLLKLPQGGNVLTKDLVPLGQVSFVSSRCDAHQTGSYVAPPVVLSQCAAQALSDAGTQVINLGNKQDGLFCDASWKQFFEETCITQVLLSALSSLQYMYSIQPLSLLDYGHGTILGTPSAELDIVRYILAPVVSIFQPTSQYPLVSATGTGFPFVATVRCSWGVANHATAQVLLKDGSIIFAGTSTVANDADTLILSGLVNLAPSLKNSADEFFIDAGGKTCQYPKLVNSKLIPTSEEAYYFGGKKTAVHFSLATGPHSTQISDLPSQLQPSNPNNEATFLAQSNNLTVSAGQSFDVYFDYENTGNTEWSDTNGYQFVCDTKSVSGASCMGGNSQGLNGIIVPPNYQATFYLTLTAPTIAGTYRLAWKMARNGTTFGQIPALLQIIVTPSPTAYISFKNNIFALNSLNGTKLWHFQLPGDYSTFFTSVTTGNGLLYFCSYNSVYALDMTSGKPRWHFEVAGTSYRSLGGNCLVLVAGTVYVFTTNGIVNALNANDGTVLWHYNYATNAQQFCCTVVVSNGTVYAGSNTDYVYAINANNGALLWKVQTNNAPSWITESNGMVCVETDSTGSPPTTYVFRASDGTELWHYNNDNPGNDSIPVVGNGMVYVGTLEKVYALDINSGAQRWQQNANIVNTMALSHGILYVSDQGGNLDAYDATTGNRIWISPTAGYILFVDSTQLYYVYGFDGALGKAYVLEAGTGKFIWSYQGKDYHLPGGTSLGIDTVASGKVYIDDGRYIHVFSTNDGTPLWDFDSGQFQSYFSQVIVS